MVVHNKRFILRRENDSVSKINNAYNVTLKPIYNLYSFETSLTDRLWDVSKAGCFNLIVFLVFCDCQCSVTLPSGALGWSAVCDCGIF